MNEAEKTLSIKFFGIGKTFEINQPPTENEMQLDGVIYRRSAGFGSGDKTRKNSEDSNLNDAGKSGRTLKNSGRKADASKGEIPSEDELQDLVKTTILDFDEAVQSADFTTFYSKISKLWQRQTSPAKLEDSFSVFIEGKNNFSGISSKEADFSSNPRVDDSKGFKELVLEGSYDTSPLPTKFTLKYTPEGKNWKLTGIVIDTTP